MQQFLNKKPIKLLSAILGIILIFSGLILTFTLEKPQVARAAWYSDAAWQYRQKIVIDHTKVVNSDQAGFPVMIKITNQYNSIFTNAKDDGTDILFTSSDGSTKLSHEIDSFSKTSKELIVWVKIPTLSYTVDTALYIYYGNAEAFDQQNKADVWSNGYTGVWHVPNGTTLSTVDSTDAYNLTNTGSVTPTAGKIYGGVSGFAANKGLSATGGTSLNSSDWTAEGWIYRTGTASYSNIILAHMSVGATGGHWMFYANSSNKLDIDLPYVKGNVVVGNTAVAQNEWVHVVASKNGNVYTVYYNGLSDGSVTDTVTNVVAGNLYAGNSSALTGPFLGSLDEFRISSTARSADWIATQYNNQADPESFITINYELSQTNYETAAEISWISTAWLYRQKIQILNNTASNLYNIQVPLSSSNIDMANVFSKAKSGGEDIRFTSLGSNVEIPYYIESYSSAGGSAKIYVKVPYIPASGNAYIYLYYGNPNISQSTSSGVNTFAAFDDFSDGSTNSRWTVTTGNGTIAESSGTLNFNYVGAENNDWWSSGKPQKIIKLNSLPGGDFEASVKINSYTPGANSHAGIAVYGSDTSAYTWGRYYFGATNNFQLEKLGIGAVATLADTALPKYLAIRKIGTTYSFWSSVDRITWAKTGSDYSDVALSNIALYGKEWGADNLIFSQDDFIVRTIAATDPTVSLSGAEEILDSGNPTNPSAFSAKNIAGGEVTLNSANYYNYATPYIDWPAVGEAGGASDAATGVDGYYLYFGTSCGDSGADPALTRGLLSDTGGGLHYTSSTEVSSPVLSSSGIYCLRVKTKDVANNVSSVTEAFVYRFENVVPTQPSYIASNPTGYSSTNSFAFSWPASSDQASSPQSGLAGYQYKRGGTAGDNWSETQVETSVSSILSYQAGENIFQVRAVDVAGNFSPEVQTNYYYSDSVPTKPTSIVATPALSETNSFAFTWTAPVHSVPIAEYGYSINAEPTIQNITWTGSNSTSLAADSFATLQGVNTIYIVAKDESGAYGLAAENYGTATFNCTTAAPPIPAGVSVSDSSNRTIDLWALTIKWSAGQGQDPATFDHYLIERSTDNVNFSQIATTSSTAYINSGLNNTTIYYYQIKSVDNAGSKSASSAVISKMPTGKFATPPTIIATPNSTATATAATISWVVSRASTSAVRFGKSESDLSRSQIDSTEKTSQSISLVGLEPGTEYYYQVQSLDNYRDYSSESAYSSTYKFNTLAAPGIANVDVSNINLNSADISWETTSASNTKVYFGASISYGTVLPENSNSMTTKHTVKLENLTHTTKYHFKIEGDDIDGNHLSSDDYTFETLPLPKISNISYVPDFTGPAPKVTISWITNVPTTSSVNYTPVSPEDAITFEESQSALVTEHKVNLAKMQNDTDYKFIISGRDQFGNLVQSDNQVLTTGADSRPPTISEVNVETSNIGLTSKDRARIIISWKTDEPSTGGIEYDEGISGNTYRKIVQADPGLTTDHVVIISDLKPQSPYHFRIIAKDKEGNQSQDIDRTVISGEISQSVFNIIVQTLTNIFGWLGKIVI